MADSRARVIVGVHDSLPGLRALRRAVAEARKRECVLHAVRAWTAPASGYAPMLRVWALDCDDAAQQEICHAFDTAMGGLPGDLDMRFVTVQGLVGPALVEYARHDDDLLVVGVGRDGWWRRLFGRHTAAYCVRRAVCPVLVVPPDELSDRMTRTSFRQLNREAARLADLRTQQKHG